MTLIGLFKFVITILQELLLIRKLLLKIDLNLVLLNNLWTQI